MKNQDQVHARSDARSNSGGIASISESTRQSWVCWRHVYRTSHSHYKELEIIMN